MNTNELDSSAGHIVLLESMCVVYYCVYNVE